MSRPAYTIKHCYARKGQGQGGDTTVMKPTGPTHSGGPWTSLCPACPPFPCILCHACLFSLGLPEPLGALMLPGCLQFMHYKPDDPGISADLTPWITRMLTSSIPIGQHCRAGKPWPRLCRSLSLCLVDGRLDSLFGVLIGLYHLSSAPPLPCSSVHKAPVTVKEMSVINPQTVWRCVHSLRFSEVLKLLIVLWVLHTHLLTEQQFQFRK